MIDLADAQHIAETLVDCIVGTGDEASDDIKAAAEEATLHSPILRLVKERNEARRLCKLLVEALPDLTHCFSCDKAMRAALEQIHQATWTWLQTSKAWDERSFK